MLQVCLRFPVQYQELVCLALDAAGVTSFVEGDGALSLTLPQGVITLYFESEEERLKTLDEIKNYLGTVDENGWLEVEPSVVVADDWKTLWQRDWKSTSIDGQLVISPPWLAGASDEGVQEIVIDPAMAFGTGTHETTKLCLRLVLQKMAPGFRVLDLGCGSGVLAIAAEKLGASEVWAIDIDPLAVEATKENARRNACSLVRAQTEIPLGREGSFDLIVANIVSSVLTEKWLIISKLLAKSGLVILSGIVESECDRFCKTLGIEPELVLKESEWVAILATARC